MRIPLSQVTNPKMKKNKPIVPTVIHFAWITCFEELSFDTIDKI
jgi:hypothetical protein